MLQNQKTYGKIEEDLFGQPVFNFTSPNLEHIATEVERILNTPLAHRVYSPWYAPWKKRNQTLHWRKEDAIISNGGISGMFKFSKIWIDDPVEKLFVNYRGRKHGNEGPDISSEEEEG